MNVTPVTIARSVTRNEGLGRTEHTIGIDRPVSRREARGHVPTGHSVRHRRPAESRDRSTLAGFDGPVWDGDAPRHEDARAFRRLPA